MGVSMTNHCGLALADSEFFRGVAPEYVSAFIGHALVARPNPSMESHESCDKADASPNDSTISGGMEWTMMTETDLRDLAGEPAMDPSVTEGRLASSFAEHPKIGETRLRHPYDRRMWKIFKWVLAIVGAKTSQTFESCRMQFCSENMALITFSSLNLRSARRVVLIMIPLSIMIEL